MEVLSSVGCYQNYESEFDDILFVRGGVANDWCWVGTAQVSDLLHSMMGN